LRYLGEGWVGEEAVALALYRFLRHPDSYEKVVIQGANTNGEFFTPLSIVQTIVNVIEPEHGTVFDPACVSGTPTRIPGQAG